MSRYIFDVTALRSYLARHSQLSGIQRVSVMTMVRAQQRLGSEHVWLGYHDRITDSYKVYPWPTDSDSDLTHYTTLCDVLHVRRSLRALPGLNKYAKKPLKLRWKIWLRDLHAWRGNNKHFQRQGLSLEGWEAARANLSRTSRQSSSAARLERIAVPGDHLILLDNAWHPRGLDRFQRQAGIDLGMKVYVFLHDLIPLVTPQYVEGDICERFHDWLTGSTDYVSCYLVNSENTAQDLRSFLKTKDVAKPVKTIPLAQALLSDPSPAPVSQATYSAFQNSVMIPDYIRAITKTPYVLVVGTMEVRKNLWQLATVWDRLRRQSGRALPKLVFAGRRGWLNDDFDALLQASGQLGGWVELVEGPDDDVLAYLYRNCLFTATVSFYEGWGLPIGESLAYGKTAVVSNTSSMPEVGGDMVEYCDPHSLDSIEAACLRLIDDPEHRKKLEERISNTQLRSWDEVAQDMLDALDRP